MQPSCHPRFRSASPPSPMRFWIAPGERLPQDNRFLKWCQTAGIDPLVTQIAEIPVGYIPDFVIPTHDLKGTAIYQPALRSLILHDLQKAYRLGADIAVGQGALDLVAPDLKQIRRFSGRILGIKGWRGHHCGTAPIEWPATLAGEHEVTRILRDARDLVAIDFEGTPSTGISVIGVANDREAAACAWRQELGDAVLACRKLIAYSALSADRAILAGAGFLTEPSTWEDAMLWHYESHRELCDSPSNSEGDSLGYLDLWTATSLVTDWPNWKHCRGSSCSGPCPLHERFAYCALDAWAAYKIYEAYNG